MRFLRKCTRFFRVIRRCTFYDYTDVLFWYLPDCIVYFCEKWTWNFAFLIEQWKMSMKFCNFPCRNSNDFPNYLFFELWWDINNFFPLILSSQASSCSDNNANCPRWTQFCTGSIYTSYMRRNCQKTCNTCDNSGKRAWF